MKPKKSIEYYIEYGLFASRWLMAPVYIGLVLALVGLLYGFALELGHFITAVPDLSPSDLLLGVLSLIDISLAGNLVLIVIFSGYENFVSKMDATKHDEDRPEWHGSVDFSALKLKLVASMVAISGIHLLKVFMDVDKFSEHQVKYMLAIHLLFVISGVLLAFMDKLAASTKALKK